MYHKKNNKKRLSAIIAAAVAAVTLATVGSTLAFLVDSDDPITNIFTPSKVTCSVVEEFDGAVKKDVSIKNTGNTDAFIRAAIVVTWKDASGNVYGVAPVENTDYSMTLNLSSTGWFKSGDYYYYRQEVEPNTATEDALITSCQLKTGAAVPSGYNLSVEILADAIQSKPANAVTSAWGVSLG